jgi:tetratricopeptide (TPR) repeat protein
LIELFVTLHQTGDALELLLQQVAAAPTLPALLDRVFQRLINAERGLLLELAVMQAPAPAAVWQQSKAAGALHLLLERHLVQSDGYGRVWLPPVYRQPICDLLTTDELAALHERAAAIFAAHGQYTLAAYHEVHAGQPERAIRLWSHYQTQEIDQGQAYAARQLFRSVAMQELPISVAEELRLILARLEHLAGNTAQAHADLRAPVWQTPLLAMEADALSGVIASDEGEYPAARGFLNRGLARAEQLLETQLAQMYKGIAWSYFQERDLAPAWKAALLAAYEVENIRGRLHEAGGEYVLAESHFLAALALAQELAHEQGVAKTRVNLSGLYTILGRYDEAKAHWNAAYAIYLRLEKTMSVAGCKINLGFLLNLAGEYATAWTTAEEVDAYLAARSPAAPRWLRAIIAQVKAEAALGLGRLDQAEWCATHAIEQDGDAMTPDATRTLAEVHFRRGDLEAAAALIDCATGLAQATGDRYLEAYAWRSAAHIHRARCQFDAAAHAAATAIDLFTTLNLPHEAAKV